ncbi:MAG: 30S ribosome-binding factor RbfA [Oscillospiraceae bacterium]|nr:30S ribosome-binding factor RbfA [Oscillospiraceae bacterium]
MSKSTLRINEDIHRELTAILRNIKDPRINQGMISITKVDTTGDLAQTKVYLSVYDLKSASEFKKGLKSASGHIRYELGRALSLRHTPALHFELDKSLERGANIASILNNLDISHDDADSEDSGNPGGGSNE